MKQISIDATKCQTADDVFASMLAAIGAPVWHGHNLNALWDSITSDINRIAPPYAIQVVGWERAPDEVVLVLDQIQSVFAEAKAERAIEVSLSFS